ncbi:MAG: hypothetical protein ACT4PT_13450, partial [Methanobacteriota archaeon]
MKGTQHGKALGLVCLLTISGLVGAAAPGASEAPGVAPPALAGAQEIDSRLREYAQGFAGAEGLAASLEAALRLPGSVDSAPGPIGFLDAMALFYSAAGIESPADLVPPPEPIAREVAPLIAATATAGLLVEQAFAGLSADERAYVLEHVDEIVAPETASEGAFPIASEAQRLAALVDMASMTAASLVLSKAMDAVQAPPSGLTPWALASTWIDPSGCIEIGSTTNDAYPTERVLIVDLGGNDDYNNHPASVTPFSALCLPVSAILDLGGNDEYVDAGFHPASPDTGFSSAVGIGGVGLIADRWGDDLYQHTILNEPGPAGPWPAPCSFDNSVVSGAVHRQVLYTQAVGVLGVGGIVDLSGNDQYIAYNAHTVSNPCHWGKTYTFSQAIGMHYGVGVLVDDTGDEHYFSYSERGGNDDNLAHTHAQAAAAGGIAALVDKEGSDDYYAEAYAHALALPDYRYKGGFAYVFSQGSVLATVEDPGAGLALAGVVTPVAADLPSPCAILGGGGQSGHGPEQRRGCDLLGAAVLVDLVGDDEFEAYPHSHEPDPCFWASWALSASQGSAAWNGLGALVNLDVEGTDLFWSHPYAEGGGCQVLNVRAYSHDQGHGGPILWDFWDHPGAPSLILSGFFVYVQMYPAFLPAIGVLVSGGVPESQTSCPAGATGIGLLNPPIALAQATCLSAKATTDPAATALVPDLRDAPDTYRANPKAVQFAPYDGSPAFAEVYAQGFGGNLANTLGPFQFPGGVPLGHPYLVVAAPGAFYAGQVGTGLGVGLHLDWEGADVFEATAEAIGLAPLALATAQGAAIDGIGILANVGAKDVYLILALENGFNMVGKTRGQAWSDGSILLTGGGIACIIVGCIGTPGIVTMALGILVDVGGFDSYSEATDPGAFGCQGNGVAFGPYTPPAPVLGP